MINLLKEITENYKWFPELLGIAGGGLLLFKRGRELFSTFFSLLWTWFVFPLRAQVLHEKTFEEIKSLKEDSRKTREDVSTLKEIIGYNGGSGLMDQVGIIVGFQSSDFWLRPQPGFICDENGRNVDCTHGYCILLGLSSKNDLAGLSWKGYVDRDEYPNYLDGFKQSAERREAFRGTVEFFNIRAQSVGEWIVVAHPISSEKAKTKRYMGFLYPGNEEAHKIARSYNWPLVPPL